MILTALGVCYSLLMISILIGNLVAKNKKYDYEPTVSILIAAKDEEENISACLESIKSQNYPAEKTQIVVVNDRSKDNTQAIIESYLPKLKDLVCVKIEKAPVGQTGKHAALKEGIKYCRGEVILFTDADCVAEPSWIERLVSHFSRDVGLVMGVPIAHKRRSKASFFTKLQSFDLTFLLSIAAGCVGLGKPASCIGNNFACRKDVLTEVDGFNSIGYTITEDASLMQKVAGKTRWKVACSYHPESVMLTKPALNFRQFLQQRSRWLIGGQKACSWSVAPLQFVFIVHLSILCLILISAARFHMPTSLLICSGLKFGSDFALSYLMLKRVKRTDLLKLFFAYEIFLISYTSIVGLYSLFVKKVNWKGEITPVRKGVF